MPPELSILIVNYNTRAKLAECLDSLLAHQGGLALEILVVDNGSKDASAELVKGYPAPVRLIHEGTNTWFSGGYNLAFEQARGEFVFILNPDTIVLPDTLSLLVDYLRQYPNVSAVTCRMEYPTDRELQRTCSALPRYLDLVLGYTFLGALLPFWRDARRQRMWYSAWERDSTRAVEVAPGSCILARRSLLQTVGVFDPRQRLYFTEDDLCWRIQQAGGTIHFVAQAILLHYERSSVQQVQRLASRIYFEDMLVYCRNRYGVLRTLLLGALVAPTRWLMDMVQRLRGERTQLA